MGVDEAERVLTRQATDSRGGVERMEQIADARRIG